MTDDVFSSQTENKQESGSALEQLVGEGKKFKTVEDLAKSKLEADSFIEQLQNENKLTREQMVALEGDKDKQATIADLIKTVKEANKQEPNSANHVTEEDLSKKIKDILLDERETSTKESNRRKANQAVLDKVKGDVEAARTYVAEKAREHGMTVEALQALGETSPSAFHKLMETNPSTVASGVASLPGQRPPANTAQVIDGHRTKAYYDNLKKEMGSARYWGDSKIQGQYTKDAMALGARFNQ